MATVTPSINTTSAAGSIITTPSSGDTHHGENKEAITLLWYDPNIDLRSDTAVTKQRLLDINHYTVFHKDLETCIIFIQSIQHEKVFLEAKKQMLDICRNYYRGNLRQLTTIDEFERHYQSIEAIRWYTKQSFIYKLVNKALKSEDIDMLYTFRFFIGDLSESLDREHKKMVLSGERTLTVYRGGKLSDDELKKFKDSIVIEMSASNAGQAITLNYIQDIRSKAEDMSVAIMFGRLMCNMGQYDKSLKYFKNLMANPHGEDPAWIEHNIGRALDFKGEWEAARKYYKSAYRRMMSVDPPRVKDSAYVLTSIGCVFRKEGHFLQALDSFKSSLEIREKFYPSDHLDIAENINNTGCVLRRLGRYLLEDLANEILYEIYEYLDVHDIYKGFYNLNNRFQNLAINSNVLTKINISIISKSNFDDYYHDIIIPNKSRINFLRLLNPFAAEIIFSPPRLILNFIRLETLVLENIQIKHLNKIFDNLIHLRKFHSLTISIGDYIESLSPIFSHIFFLSKLKYCKIEYQTKDYEDPLLTIFTQYDYSPIQWLIINGRFPFDAFNKLLCCLPKLQHLSIDCLVQSRYYAEEEAEEENLSLIQLKYLKYVSLRIDYIEFKKFEKTIIELFHYVQILHLTTYYDEAYLDAKRWQRLIVSNMPYLRIFDINHKGSVKTNTLTYHDVINEFNSSFWFENKWFFTHQHIWKDQPDNGIFYSIAPYRRKDYVYHWESNEPICSRIQKEDYHLVKHLYICSKEIKDNYISYFPNVNQLTIKHHFETSNDSISKSLRRMIPLKQLTKLVIECYKFTFTEIIQLLRFTPNLYALKLDYLPFGDINLNVIKQNKVFQYVSNRNKIKILDFRVWCSFDEIQLVVNLFPRLEYLKIGLNRKEIQSIVRFLLSKPNNKTQNLFFLCILQIPKICLKELSILIKSENLLNDYCSKFINRDLYLWW
ncbi:unnamed protein product [Rotaria sp. Silwood1]|nr:unnamed protein product [Rotaria sp. Silwood1]